MDDIGNWLYIIVLIIAGISGLFGSGKKKKQTMDTPEYPEYEDDDATQTSDDKGFWDLFDEVMNEPKKQPEPERKVIVPPVQPKATVSTKPQSSSVNRFSHVTVPFGKEEIGSLLNEDDNIDDHYLLENEDFHDLSELRKAIIYTEILNRKY